MPQNAFCQGLAIFWSAEKRCKDFFPCPPSPFPCNSCKLISRGICTVSQFCGVRLPLLYTAWSNATYPEIGPEVAAPTFHDLLRESLRKAFTLANQLRWTAQQVSLWNVPTVVVLRLAKQQPQRPRTQLNIRVVWVTVQFRLDSNPARYYTDLSWLTGC